jgi:hypothetical protein
MNDEQMKVARELAGHSRFEWRAGMKPCAAELALFVWKLDRVEEDGWNPQHCDDIALPQGWPDAKREAWPDLTDDATGGVLLGMLGDWWAVRIVKGGVTVRPSGQGERSHLSRSGATLAEACARVLLAAWAREVPGE